MEQEARLRKKNLRKDLRARIEENIGHPESAVKEILAYLQKHPDLRVVALYSALPGEVDLRALVDQMDRIWLFPKVEGEALVFSQIKNADQDLKAGAFGISEPREDLKCYEIEKIDLFLCPGLGFDLKGGRIGRGKGFYDKALSRARRSAVKLGVCFGFQLVDEIPMEPHDVKMDGVIAP